jgi:hypothetical protein
MDHPLSRIGKTPSAPPAPSEATPDPPIEAEAQAARLARRVAVHQPEQAVPVGGGWVWALPSQFSAVFAAPIPFFLALVVVAALMWRALKWAYDTRLDKANFFIEMAKRDADHFKLREAELISENQVMTDKIAELEKEKASLSDAGQKALAELADSTERTDPNAGRAWRYQRRARNQFGFCDGHGRAFG